MEQLLHFCDLRLMKEVVVAQLAISPSVTRLTHIAGMVAIAVQKAGGTERIVQCRTQARETADGLCDVTVETVPAKLAVVARGVPGTVEADSRVGVTQLGEGIARTGQARIDGRARRPVVAGRARLTELAHGFRGTRAVLNRDEVVRLLAAASGGLVPEKELNGLDSDNFCHVLQWKELLLKINIYSKVYSR